MKPVIGITGPDSGGYTARLCLNFSVLLVGGKPMNLIPSKSYYADELDGLIVSGGTDINPVIYGQHNHKDLLYDDARDQMEISLIKKMLVNHRPILGICRGAQLINVVLGGNLHQDVSGIYEEFVPVNSLLGKIFYRKKIFLDKNTYLYRKTLKRHTFKVNSLHRQAINELGQYLNISAKEEYGLIQAIESVDMNDQYLIGVQWHPEYLIYKKLVRRIFRDFVSSAI